MLTARTVTFREQSDLDSYQWNRCGYDEKIEGRSF